MPKPTTSDIIAAHGAHVVGQLTPQPLDVWACEAMGIPLFRIHQFDADNPYPYRCRHCSSGPKEHDKKHCIRYTTDLTSVGELEDMLSMVGYSRLVLVNDGVSVTDSLAPPEHEVFGGKTLPVNWCAAILWADAHERERADQPVTEPVTS